MKKLLMILATLALASCTNYDDGKRALDAEGFTEVQFTGYGWLACSEDDFYHTKFTAKNASGKRVSGVVCSGLLFKNATIRY